jgi:murein DD-endopeptidase MepM/ murein hydrolase activator NlpD
MRRKRTGLAFVVILIPLLLLAGGGALFYFKFEGETPALTLTPEPRTLGPKTVLELRAGDRRSGLKAVRVQILQGNRTVSVLEERYAPRTREMSKTLNISPRDLDLEDGEALIRAEARDHSWRPGGNPNVLEAVIKIDTRPPNIGVLSRFHYINQGGACLVLYRAAEELARSGVKAGELWFPSFPLEDGTYLCLFAVPYNLPRETSIVLVSEDLAGNLSRTPFRYQIRPKSFRHDTIRLSDRFLQRVTLYFMDRDPSLKGDPLDVFLRINRDYRRTDAEKIQAFCRETYPQPLWSGPFLRMENAKTMARFADHRVYLYQGKEIDRQVHLGVDLASVTMAPVKAANRGRVVFAGELGIYGNTIMLDHGCSLFSMYAHLSRADVQKGQTVEKGEPLGLTGATGLAGGDHLHLSILINGIFVNPIEWWDPHWVADNVDSKMALAQASGG